MREFDSLSDREKSILRYIIQQFILTAAPVGSRNITKRYDIGLSPATVRNIMADLEESGFIDHPHTSAGRIPTDKGYRLYVDLLMDRQDINAAQKAAINKQLEKHLAETDNLLEITSKILSSITSQLGCVIYPRLESGELERLQIVRLSSERILVVISIKSGFVKTISLEVTSDIKDSQIHEVQNLLNERLAGLKLSVIRETFAERFKDVGTGEKSVLNFFYDSLDKIFMDLNSGNKALITGARNLLVQPEFEIPEKFESVIELIEEKDIIIHIFDKASKENPELVNIKIGQELKEQNLEDYSLVTKEYKIGDVVGTLGIVGPKRMEYNKIAAIVDYISKAISDILLKN